MTQHDHQANQDFIQTPDGEIEAVSPPEDVTREQGGQFLMESESIISPLEEGVEAQEDVSLVGDSVDTINALQVTMDRSGAEYIHAQKTFLTNSGAKSIEGRSSKLTQSGVLQLRADKAELYQSSVVMSTSDDLQMQGGSIVFSTSERAMLNEGANVSVLQARSVEANGNISAFMLFSNTVKAGGNVETAVDIKSAAAFGAVFGVVFAFLWKLIGPRD